MGWTHLCALGEEDTWTPAPGSLWAAGEEGMSSWSPLIIHDQGHGRSDLGKMCGCSWCPRWMDMDWVGLNLPPQHSLCQPRFRLHSGPWGRGEMLQGSHNFTTSWCAGLASPTSLWNFSPLSQGHRDFSLMLAVWQQGDSSAASPGHLG